MRMRWKPNRGEKYLLKDGRTITMVEVLEKDMCKVLNTHGKLESMPKSDIPLPVIETKDWEKLK